MARKKAETTADGVDVSGNNLAIDTSAQPNGVAVPAGAIPLTFEPIQINNYNLTDLKNTLDDALKRVRSLGTADTIFLPKAKDTAPLLSTVPCPAGLLLPNTYAHGR